MKIAFIVEPRKIIGGGVRAALNLAQSLQSDFDSKCSIFGIFKSTVKSKDVSLYEVRTLNSFSIGYLRSLYRFLQTFDPDIVHCLGLYTSLLCLFYRIVFRKKFKVVCTVHRVTMNVRHKKLVRYLNRFVASHIDYATFLTNHQKAHYFNNLYYSPKQSEVIPNVIYIREYAKSERKDLYNELSNKLHANYIISFVGRIIPSKNLEAFIKVISELNKRGLNVGGVIVGGYDDDYYQRLAKVIVHENIKDKIAFIGYVENPTLYIGASDFILFPTRTEALPNLLIESYALGKVVISSDIPQLQDLIADSINGFKIPVDDINKYADCIQFLINNPNKNKSIEEHALLTYHKEYAPDVVTQKYYDIYKKV